MRKLDTAVTTAADDQFISVIVTEPHSAAIAGAEIELIRKAAEIARSGFIQCVPI
jgi:hypothetical protein